MAGDLSMPPAARHGFRWRGERQERKICWQSKRMTAKYAFPADVGIPTGGTGACWNGCIGTVRQQWRIYPL